MDSLLPLKERLENPDNSVLYKTCSDLTKVQLFFKFVIWLRQEPRRLLPVYVDISLLYLDNWTDLLYCDGLQAL